MNITISDYQGKFFRSKIEPGDFIEVIRGNDAWLFVHYLGTSEVSWLTAGEIDNDYDEIKPEVSLPQVFN